MSAQLPGWVVFRYDLARRCWFEVGCANAPDAGSAFRQLVLLDGAQPNVGEYRVLPLEGSAHLAVEMNLRDLDAPS